MIAYVFQKYSENVHILTIYNFTAIYLTSNNLTTRAAMNVRISMFQIFVESIVYLLLSIVVEMFVTTGVFFFHNFNLKIV